MATERHATNTTPLGAYDAVVQPDSYRRATALPCSVPAEGAAR